MAYLKTQYKRMQSGGAVPPDEPEPEQSLDARIDALGLPPHAREWVRQHESVVTDEATNAKARALHGQLLAQGHHAYSADYMRQMEIGLGFAEPEADDNAREAALAVARSAQRRAPPPDPEERSLSRRGYSAPVSREYGPSSYDELQTGSRSGMITLGPAEKEAAKIAGVSEAEYAHQMLKLRELKARGQYG
jgi:hypothetical protein